MPTPTKIRVYWHIFQILEIKIKNLFSLISSLHLVGINSDFKNIVKMFGIF